VLWPHPEARSALLAAFLNPRARATVVHEHWSRVIGESVDVALDALVADGKLESPPLVDHIASAHSGVQLKAMAKERGLPSSGRKDQVAARLVKADESGMRAIAAAHPRLACSPGARAEAQAYLDREKRLAAEATRSSLSLLRAGRNHDAARAVGAYESARVHPRGIGVDWAKYPGEHDLEILHHLGATPPKYLSSLDDSQFAECRVGAAMMSMWGRKFDTGWCPDLPLEVGRGIPSDVAVRMLLFSAQSRASLSKWRQAGIRRVRISQAGDTRTCASCAALSGPFSIDEAPELPHADCGSETGCRCTYLAAFE
jgi:hypothetical protein